MSTTMNPVRVAALNTVFRIVTVLVLTPFIRTLGKLACAIMKDEPAKTGELEPAGDWDLLDALVLLENQGKVHTENGASQYTTQDKQQDAQSFNTTKMPSPQRKSCNST